MTKLQTRKLIREIRKARGEEETILGENPEQYLHDLRKNPDHIRKILQDVGILTEKGKLAARYR